MKLRFLLFAVLALGGSAFGQIVMGPGPSLSGITLLAQPACNPPNYIGPPDYPCGSASIANPGQITYLFTSATPSGTVNTSNGAIAPCSANCMQYVSGDNFVTSWQTGVGAGNGGNIHIAGAAFGVSAWNSTTVATLMSAPGTQTGAAYINHTACKPGTASFLGAGCQNSVSEDLTIPGHITGSNLITRVTDGASFYLGHPVGNLTASGGDNDRMFSYPLGTYLWVGGGGTVLPYQLSTTNHYVQVVNAGCVPPNLFVNAFATSWITETTFYYISGSVLNQASLSGSGCSLAISAPTPLVDFMGAGVCNGVTPFTPTGAGVLGVSKDDDTFSVTLNPTGGQAHADIVFSWSRTKGCTTVNFKTGQVYCAAGWGGGCSGGLLGTMATGATNCWGSDGSTSKGIHDSLGSGDGLFVVVSPTPTWAQGGCAGVAGSSAMGQTIWQMGTLGNQWCSNTGGSNLECGDHMSAGISALRSPGQTGSNTRPLSNVSAFTIFLPQPNAQDIHQSWPHNDNGVYDDLLPWIGNTDVVTTIALAGCTGAGAFISSVYCPTYPNNVLTISFPLATYPPGKILTINHTGACGIAGSGGQCADGIADAFGSAASIGVASPKGDMFCWASSIWHQVGIDSFGVPRIDAYCTYLGHP